MIKNITLSAEESIISHARKKAMKDNTTLNSLFREWMFNYLNRSTAVENYEMLINSLQSVSSDKKFTRKLLLLK